MRADRETNEGEIIGPPIWLKAEVHKKRVECPNILIDINIMEGCFTVRERCRSLMITLSEFQFDYCRIGSNNSTNRMHGQALRTVFNNDSSIL